MSCAGRRGLTAQQHSRHSSLCICLVRTPAAWLAAAHRPSARGPAPGLGRAPATALAYMYWCRGMALGDAIATFMAARPCNPRIGAIRAATADLLLDGGRRTPVTIAVHRPGLATRFQASLAGDIGGARAHADGSVACQTMPIKDEISACPLTLQHVPMGFRQHAQRGCHQAHRVAQGVEHGGWATSSRRRTRAARLAAGRRCLRAAARPPSHALLPCMR